MSSTNMGLAALANSLKTRESKDREFQNTMVADQYIRNQQLEKQQYAAQEQQYYENINAKADELLGYDKARIQEKAIALQRDMKEKIKMYGGSQKLFMRSGGQALLGKMSRNITGSQEFATYQKNKENLARIMDAQSKGMGHLLTQNDLDSMRNYEKNKGGEISFSGIMAEIELPDPNNYDLNQNIPMEDILGHKDNYLKILGNYKMHFPGDEDVTREEVKAFANKMGYGGQGSNRDALNFRRKLMLLKASQKPTKDKARKEDDRDVNTFVEAKRMLQYFPSNMPVEEIYSKENADFFRKAAANNGAIRQNFSSDEWNFISKKHNLDETGIDVNSDQHWLGRKIDEVYQDNFKLANAASWMPLLKDQIAGAVLQKEVVNGKIDLEPNENFYRMDGVKLDGSEKLEPEIYKGKYEILGISAASKTVDSQGKEQLLMTVHDNDGELDEEMTAKFADNLKGNTAKSTMVIAVRDESQNIFYREIDFEDQNTINVLSKNLGENAILNDLHDSQRLNEETNQAATRMAEEQIESNRNQYITIDNELQENPSFKMEAHDFASLSDPSLNRSNLMKGFYLASSGSAPISSLVEKNLFTEIVSLGGEEILSSFKDFKTNKSDEKLIDDWLMAVSQDLDVDTPEGKKDFQDNVSFASQWKASLKNYKKINS